MSHDTPFNRILGTQLSAVSFVMDYVEFHFEGPVIRALADPILVDKLGTVRFPEPSSRDRLTGLIGSIVRAVEIIDVLELRIRFPRAELIVPIDAARVRGPEALHFQESVTAPVQVWETA